MAKVNVRALKDQLSAYLRRAEAGERVIVERDGRPIAALVPLSDVPADDEDSVIAGLVAVGALRLPEEPDARPFGAPRVPSRGKPAAAMIIEDRG